MYVCPTCDTAQLKDLRSGILRLSVLVEALKSFSAVRWAACPLTFKVATVIVLRGHRVLKLVTRRLTQGVSRRSAWVPEDAIAFLKHWIRKLAQSSVTLEVMPPGTSGSTPLPRDIVVYLLHALEKLPPPAPLTTKRTRSGKDVEPAVKRTRADHARP